MVFKFSCEVVGLRDNLQDTTGAEFQFNSPLTAVVHLSRKYSDGRDPADPSSVICVGTTAGEIEDDTCASEIHAVLSSPPDGRWANFKVVDASRIPAVLAAVDRFFVPLRTLTESTVSILKWRSGLSEMPMGPFRNLAEHFSHDGSDWREVHMARSASLTFTPGPRQIEVSPELELEVSRLVSEKNGEEPLGRQLFREAWNQRVSHPRSALVIGVGAVEVGLKTLFGTLAPAKRRKLKRRKLSEMLRNLRESLPTLPIKARLLGKTIAPPSNLITKLQTAVQRRNAVVHAGEAPPHRTELEEMLRAVDDFLWICDLYVGHLWVAGYISRDTFATWENE
jgi:hypothetical protein